MFVLAFIGEAAGNGTQAAVMAGYAANSAAVTACRLLRRPDVIGALEETRRELEERRAAPPPTPAELLQAGSAVTVADVEERANKS